MCVMCVDCSSTEIVSIGKTDSGKKRYLCKSCHKKFQIERIYFKNSDCLMGFIFRLKKSGLSCRQIKEFLERILEKKVSHTFINNSKSNESYRCSKIFCPFCSIDMHMVYDYFLNCKRSKKSYLRCKICNSILKPSGKYFVCKNCMRDSNECEMKTMSKSVFGFDSYGYLRNDTINNLINYKKQIKYYLYKTCKVGSNPRILKKQIDDWFSTPLTSL